MSKELMRRAIIDMILWTDSEEKNQDYFLASIQPFEKSRGRKL